MVGLKIDHIRKHLTENGEPQRSVWGLQKKKKKHLISNKQPRSTFVYMFQAHDVSVRAMRWSHNDLWMVTADHGGYVKYWQSNMNNVKMYQGHKEPIRGVRLAPAALALALRCIVVPCPDGDTPCFVVALCQCSQRGSLVGNRACLWSMVLFGGLLLAVLMLRFVRRKKIWQGVLADRSVVHSASCAASFLWKSTSLFMFTVQCNHALAISHRFIMLFFCLHGLWAWYSINLVCMLHFLNFCNIWFSYNILIIQISCLCKYLAYRQNILLGLINLLAFLAATLLCVCFSS